MPSLRQDSVPSPSSTNLLLWPPSRAEAVRRAADFAPRADRTYAAQRNYDRGPGRHTNVSVLSPYVRQRVITERELIATVLDRFTLASAEKFVAEVFWRTYWKGWLESHPAAWTRYRQTLAIALDALAAQTDLRARYEAALDGRTGIDAFDAWAHELVEHHYLHNHARMWFASIWIFTLGLPWELGADFFMRNLLDGDPASNTLSWRWVAGLHTRGKSYTATRDNIRRYTEDRFALADAPLRTARALEDAPLPLVPLLAVPASDPGDVPSLLILHEDDLHGDLSELPPRGVRGVCAIRSVRGRSPQAVDEAVVTFGDALAREAVGAVAAACSAREFETFDAGAPEVLGRDLLRAAEACGASRLIAPFAPIGPARDALTAIRAHAVSAGFAYGEFGRRYDALAWPAATRGFFNLRSRIPTIVAELGIGAG